jgi:AAT family amino acid transporter
VAVVLEMWVPGNAFVYILSGALFGLMLSWLVSLAAHISCRRQMGTGQLSELPMRSPLGAGGSMLGLTLVIAAILKTWWDSRISLLSGLSTLLVLSVAYMFLRLRDTT